MKAMSKCLVDIEKKKLQSNRWERFWKSLTQIYYLLQHGMGLRVPAWETVLLELSLPCFWDLSIMLRKRLCGLVAERFLGFFYLYCSYNKVGGGVVRMYENWKRLERTELFLLRVIRSTCTTRTPSTRSVLQMVSRDCKKSGIWEWWWTLDKAVCNAGISSPNFAGLAVKRNCKTTS